MGIRSRLDVSVDLLTKRVQVGELAMAATRIGAEISIGSDPDPEKGHMRRAQVTDQAFRWGSENLWRLVYLQALCDGTTTDRVLADIRADLERERVPADRVPIDTSQSGENSAT